MAVAPSQNLTTIRKKLDSFVPDWWFQDLLTQDAFFEGIAAIFSALDVNTAEYEDQTYICRAEEPYVDEHASERGISRNPEELDPSLQQRTKNLVNQNNCAALKEIVDALLITGESIFQEGFDPPFFDREAYFDRGDIFTTRKYNYFYITIPEQLEPGLGCFMDRDGYFDRDECFFSSSPRVVRQDIYDAITTQVDKSKACGALYIVIVSNS